MTGIIKKLINNKTMEATFKFNCSTIIPNRWTIKNILIIALVWLFEINIVHAQNIEYTKPSWWLGLAGGSNFNYYRGSTHQLNSGFTPLTTFHNGNGIGFLVAPLLEYHKQDTRLGFQFQLGLDDRSAKFDQSKTVCECPSDLKTKISYWTLEPNLRYAPFKTNFYLLLGPRFAFIKRQYFVYQLGVNPAYPNQTVSAEIIGNFDKFNKTIISMQIGAGIDIPLLSDNNKIQFIISPFASFHPYFGQNPRFVETWNVTTIRVGISLKNGFW